MRQISRFYLTEFLKTQRYFIPVMILFLQFFKMDYAEIFILYAVESLVVFLLEIPSGVIADQFGKKASLVFARVILIPAYILFALGDGFWMFLFAMIFMGINKAFKSGTHKAYIYDYIEQNKTRIGYSEVIGKNKFWGRVGEAGASFVGGIIAVRFGFSAVFVFALIPAVLNAVNAVLYEKIEEKHKQKGFSFVSHVGHIKDSFDDILGKRIVLKIIVNSAIFAFCIEGGNKFLQPYMTDAQIPVAVFGIIYSGIFLVAAFGSRYAHLFEKRFKREKVVNGIGWFLALLFFVLGTGYVSYAGVILFLFIIVFRNIRRPLMITELNDNIDSRKRATIISAGAFLKALIGVIFLPAVGYLSDMYSIYIGMLVLGGILVVNQLFFGVRG